MHVEVGERRLREIFEGDHDLAGDGIGPGRAEELDVGAEPVSGKQQAVRFPGFGSAR